MNFAQRVGVRTACSTLTALALGAAGVAALATTASAAELHVIDGVEITQNSEITNGSYVRIDATWSVEDGAAKSGDTFTLSLPSDHTFAAHPIAFELTDPDATTIGSCVANEFDISCTFNEFVESHTGVHGSLYVWATAQKTSTEELVTFTAGGEDIEVPLPGGGIYPNDAQVWPTSPIKTGKVQGDHAGWSIIMPGSTLLAAPGDTTITDTYDARLGEVVKGPKVYWVTKEQWTSANPWGYDQYLADTEFSSTLTPESHSLSVTIKRDAIQAERLYLVQYENRLPANVADGDEFTNHVVGNGWETDGAAMLYGAGGAGVGLLRAEPGTPCVPGGPVTPECPVTPVAPAGPGTPVAPDAPGATPTANAAPAPAATTASAKPSTAAKAQGKDLPRTGAAVLGVAGVALALLAGGAAVLIIRRRSRSA